MKCGADTDELFLCCLYGALVRYFFLCKIVDAVDSFTVVTVQRRLFFFFKFAVLQHLIQNL